MKGKTLIVTIAAIAVCSLSSAALGWFLADGDIGVAKVADHISVSEEEQYEYMIKEFNEKLAVFKKGSETPEMVFDVFIHHLPEYDRAKIEDGVKVKDYETLVSLLQDYTS